MSFPDILRHGVKDGVTSSCQQLLMDAQHSLLIDCRLFQGAEGSAEGNTGADWLAVEFHPDRIKALVATYVHIDHIGHIPYLLAVGFKPTLCSEPSAKLLSIVLGDAFARGYGRDQKQVERYLNLIEQRIIALRYKRWFTLHGTGGLVCRIRPQLTGHIVGSAYVEIDLHYPQSCEKKRVVFSSDLGAPQELLSPAPKPPYRADILVAENAYGDRLQEDRRTRRRCSGRIVNHLKTVLLTHDAASCRSATRQGTSGRVSKNGGYAVLDGQRCDIRAQIHTIGGNSAHAGQKGLVYFVTRMREWPSEVRIAHGEPGSKSILAKRLQGTYANKRLPLRVTIPS